MRRTNERMNNILEQVNSEKPGVITILPNALQELIFPNTKRVHDCIIIDNRNEVIPEKVNYNRVMSMYGDQIGYKASCNEVRISDYINEGKRIDEVRLAQIVIQGWRYKLKKEYPQDNFWIDLICTNDYTTLRFYLCRDSTKGWLKEDLESYLEEAILEEIY